MGDLLTFEDALRLLTSNIPVLGDESLPVGQALNRTLAEDVRAPRPQPPVALSAMDGYALSGGEQRVFEVVREIPAGAAAGDALVTGQAARIFTGAEVPAGADRVVMQENVTLEGASIRVHQMPESGQNIRLPGIDFSEGEVLASAGDGVTAMRSALVAAGNRATIRVRQKPKVAIFATGDELVEPGSPLTPSAIINSVSYGVAAQVADFGGEPIIQPILPDQEEAIADAFRRVLSECDVVVTIGGASVGAYDLVKPAMRSLGAEMLFEKIAVRPGKPTWHARFPDGPVVLGLPGNPASASVCAYLFLAPLMAAHLDRWRGDHSWVTAEAAARISANGARESFLRGRVSLDAGRLRVTPSENQDSSLLTPLARGNALIRRPSGADEVERGGTVQVLMIGSLT